MATQRVLTDIQSSQSGFKTFQNTYAMQAYMKTQTDRVLCLYQNGVYDVTDFISDHPGGEDIIEKYNGKDITQVFSDENVHPHSQNAKRILAQYKIGEIIGENKDLVRDDEERPYPLRVEKVLHFDDFTIDLSKGYFYQIWKLSYKQYMEVVDNPVTVPFYVPLFDNKYLDMCTTTKWYTILMTWIPIAICHFYFGLSANYSVNSNLDPFVKLGSSFFSLFAVLALFIFGILFWSIAEYSLHRFMFHMETWMPDQSLYRYLAFMIHGVHHALPMDDERLVFPPSLGLILYYCITNLIYTFLPGNAGRIFIAGFILGYVYYDMMHYYLHHNNPQIEYLKSLKSAHNKHHYLDDSKGFGITNKFWDTVFGTKFN